MIVEVHTLRVTPKLPKKDADQNLCFLKNGHQDELRFGSLEEFKQFLVDQTSMVRGQGPGGGEEVGVFLHPQLI